MELHDNWVTEIKTWITLQTHGDHPRGNGRQRVQTPDGSPTGCRGPLQGHHLISAQYRHTRLDVTAVRWPQRHLNQVVDRMIGTVGEGGVGRRGERVERKGRGGSSCVERECIWKYRQLLAVDQSYLPWDSACIQTALVVIRTKQFRRNCSIQTDRQTDRQAAVIRSINTTALCLSVYLCLSSFSLSLHVCVCVCVCVSVGGLL